MYAHIETADTAQPLKTMNGRLGLDPSCLMGAQCVAGFSRENPLIRFGRPCLKSTWTSIVRKTIALKPFVPGPPKEPKIMDQYPKIESIGSIGSVILAILEVQVLV